MGYLLRTGDESIPHGSVSVTDAVWLEATEHASEGGYSVPHLRMLGLGDGAVRIEEEEAEALHESLLNALRTSLKDAPVEVPEGDRLDRDTVHRITHVLRCGDVSLVRTPHWK